MAKDPYLDFVDIPGIVEDAAQTHGVPSDIFHSLIKHESDYNPYARNPKSSATGLGQIIKGTGKSLKMNVTGGPDDERFDPVANAQASARYLKDLYNQTGSWETALSRYGEGPKYARTILKAAKVSARTPQKVEDPYAQFLPPDSAEQDPYAQFIAKPEEAVGAAMTKEMLKKPKPPAAVAPTSTRGIPGVRHEQDWITNVGGVSGLGSKPQQEPETITPELVMRGAPEAAQIRTPQGEELAPAVAAFGRGMELPFVPLRKGLEKAYEYLLEPAKDRSLKEWSEALETAPEMLSGAPEAFAPIGSKEAFVEPLEFLLAPAYLRFVGKAGQVLKEVGKENFYKYAPQWAFKPFAKGGLPVPLSSTEVAEKLAAMSGSERAEMARKYPQFRESLEEMVTKTEATPGRPIEMPEVKPEIPPEQPPITAPEVRAETLKEMKPTTGKEETFVAEDNFVGSIKSPTNKDKLFPIYRNPEKSDIKDILKSKEYGDGIRFIGVGDDRYVMSNDVVHSEAIGELQKRGILNAGDRVSYGTGVITKEGNVKYGESNYGTVSKEMRQGKYLDVIPDNTALTPPTPPSPEIVPPAASEKVVPEVQAGTGVAGKEPLSEGAKAAGFSSEKEYRDWLNEPIVPKEQPQETLAEMQDRYKLEIKRLKSERASAMKGATATHQKNAVKANYDPKIRDAETRLRTVGDIYQEPTPPEPVTVRTVGEDVTEMEEISARVRQQQIKDAELNHRRNYQNLMTAQDKTAVVDRLDQEDAIKILSELNAAPGDNPLARDAIYKKFPELKPIDPKTYGLGEEGFIDPGIITKPIQAVIEDTATLLRNAKPATQRTYAWMKDNGNRLWEWYKSPIALNMPKDYKRIIYDYLGNEQIAGYKNKQYLKNLQKTIPEKLTREGITNWIEAGGDEKQLQEWASKSTDPKLKRGYEAALKLTPEDKVMAAEIAQMYNQWFQEAKAAGILESSLENYVNHLYDQGIVDKSQLQKFRSEVNAGMFNTNFNYAKKRIFGSYFEAEQAGKIPKNKDIAFLLGHYYQSMHRAINARKAIKALHEGVASDGRPLVEVVGGLREIGNEIEGKPFEDVPPEYDMTGDKTPEAYLVRPKITPEEARDYIPGNHSALRKWKWIGKDPNGAPILMHGDMYIHPEAATHLKNVLARSKVRDYMIGRGALKVSQNLKGVLLSGFPTGFHQTHVMSHAAFHKVNPFTAPPLDFENPIQQRLVKNGLMVYNHNALSQFAEGLHSTGIAVKTPGIGRVTQMYGEYLFQDLIPRLKMKMGVDAYERNLEKYKGKYTEDEIAEITSNQSNAAFGELNYKAMGRNPTMQDMFRLIALAPDFLEARMRFAGQAVRPGGSEQRWALFRAILGMYAAGVIGNMLFSDGHKPHWDKPFTMVIGKTAYSLRSVPGDIMHLVKDPRSFVYHRMNPSTLKPVVEAFSKRDVYGRLRTSGEQVGDYFKGFVPIPLQFMVSEGEKTLIQAGLQTIGVTSYKNRTKLDQVIMDYYTEKAKLNLPKDERERNRKRREIVRKYQEGDKGGFEKALKEFKRKDGLALTPKQIENIRTRAKNEQAYLIKGMDADKMPEVWDAADPDEKMSIVRVVNDRILNLEEKEPAKAKLLSPQIKKIRGEMRDIYRMQRAQKAVSSRKMTVDEGVAYIERGATKQ